MTRIVDPLKTAMMVRSDAKAVGMVTATRVGGARHKQNTYVRASECITYRNRDRSDATIFRSARAEKRATTVRSSSANAPKRLTSADRNKLIRSLSPIGDTNH